MDIRLMISEKSESDSIIVKSRKERSPHLSKQDGVLLNNLAASVWVPQRSWLFSSINRKPIQIFK